MAISFEDIARVNQGLGTVDVKGKEYVVVPQRVKAFRMLYPQGFIITDILSSDGTMVVMQAKAGYYDENGNPVTLGTGLAFEKPDSSYINKTSYIENCETSAIGRALGFLGLGIDGAICSAEELINAKLNQKDKEAPKDQPQNQPKASRQGVTVTTGTTVPPIPQNPPQAAPQPQQPAPAPAAPPASAAPPATETPAGYIKRMIGQMSADFGPTFNFMAARKALIDGGQIPNKPSAEIRTMEEAQQMIKAFYDNFVDLGKKAG